MWEPRASRNGITSAVDRAEEESRRPVTGGDARSGHSLSPRELGPLTRAPHNDAMAERARRVARMGWSELESQVSECTACNLHTTRTQAVFGIGNQTAEWMIVGEAPGADEDRLGEPFVGRAGKLLDAMLLALGLRREQVYIANILKSRPPNNRDPRPDEVQACWPFLLRQIRLVEPGIILAVGRIAAQNLLLTDLPVGKLRGRVHRFGECKIPVVVSYHPAYLLRAPAEKQKVWEDLQLAQRILNDDRSISTASALRHDES